MDSLSLEKDVSRAGRRRTAPYPTQTTRNPVGYQASAAMARLRARLADHLFRRGDAFQHLEPGVHTEREHALLDRRVPDLGGADVHHDQLPNARRHDEHLIDTLPALEPGAAAFVAATA